MSIATVVSVCGPECDVRPPEELVGVIGVAILLVTVAMVRVAMVCVAMVCAI